MIPTGAIGGASPTGRWERPRSPDAKPRILVADDTPSNVALLNLVLGKDHELLCVGDGREAIALALAEHPDLILLDALMPGMDGFDACAQLKADPQTADIPVIFITSLDEETDEARALQLGAVDFISKPISPVAVQARIRNCLDLKRQRDLLGQLSLTDGLTGIPNRRCLDVVLEQEWRRACRARAPLSLVILDVDEFKRFNDAAGHLAGDECLKRVAACAASAILRPADLVARYGGEEFAAVLPDTGPEGALEVANRMQRALAALAIPHPDSDVSEVVTASAGVATAMPPPPDGPADLVRAADGALYAAKQQGRNRVVVAPDAGAGA